MQAIRDQDPVIFCEHKMLYGMKGEVPEELYTVPFGQARVVREGSDATIVAFGRMVTIAEQAASDLAQAGIEVEILDPRTTSPLDEDAILASVGRTGRLVVVDESSPRCGMAADIAALVATRGFGSLRAPIRTVTPPHTPVPFATVLEQAYIPSPARVADAVREVVVKEPVP